MEIKHENEYGTRLMILIPTGNSFTDLKIRSTDKKLYLFILLSVSVFVYLD